MYIKKLKRKCSVRGCKNTDTYAISRTREIGNSVIVCRGCLEEALKVLDAGADKVEVKKESPGIPALFFHDAGIKEKPEENISAITEEEPAEDESVTEITPITCPHCDREFETERGLKQHMKSCEKQG